MRARPSSDLPAQASVRRQARRSWLDGEHDQAHAVRCYETEGFLAIEVADDAAAGLAGGQAVSLIATGPHRAAVATRLQGGGDARRRPLDR